ncbi:putative small nuclear ribonucleoprotein Lsm8 [Xylariaceae sp. FL0255]|nr:putative small nuclear ribonucleoprotein Lsm8 [Xylariaceae sp. FL0255]
MSNLNTYVNSTSDPLDHRRATPVYLRIIESDASNHLITEKVLILTADSRTLVGNLLSCDQQTNLVLGQTVERIIHTPDDDEASTEVPLGLYIVRGDNVCVVGLVDEPLDESIKWDQVKGSAIGGIKHI